MNQAQQCPVSGWCAGASQGKFISLAQCAALLSTRAWANFTLRFLELAGPVFQPSDTEALCPSLA